MVKKNTNTIEFNGQRYDANTGKVLSLSSNNHLPARNLDGIIAGKSAPHPALSTPTPVALKPILKTDIKKPVMDINRVRPQSLKSHKPEQSKTLMRSAVQKPGQPLKRQLHVQAPHNLSLTQPKEVVPKLSARRIDPRRERLAEAVGTSQYVKHFSNGDDSPLVGKLPLKPTHDTPIAQKIHQASTAAKPTNTKPSMDLFEKALQSATAHEQLPVAITKKGRISSRVASILTLALIAIAVGGFLTYRNIPNIKLDLASSKAGFQASLPSYHPSGFTIGAFKASPGALAVSFHSNSDTRAYTLSEKSSNWDSDTLLDTVVIPNAGQNYQTIQAAGRTIYVYNNADATWVNAGIWYSLQTNGSLGTTQLVEIATSM